MTVGTRALISLLLLVSLVAGCGPADGDADTEVEIAVHRFVEVGDVRWHYVEAGAGETVVLLHGMPETWHAWRGQLVNLAADYRVLAPDLKGMGLSTAPDGDFSFAGVARDVRELLDALGVERFRLAGQGWGALVGARLASDNPDRVAAYAHVAAPIDHYDLTRLPDFLGFHEAPASAARFLSIADVFVPRLMELGWHGGLPAIPVPLLQRRIDDFGRRGVAEAVARYFRDLELGRDWSLGPASVADWSRLLMPVTVVLGARDLQVPSEATLGLDDRVPGSFRLVLIDGAGHYPAEERPEELSEALREVFTRS